jgi:subtilisin family serine protease
MNHNHSHFRITKAISGAIIFSALLSNAHSETPLPDGIQEVGTSRLIIGLQVPVQPEGELSGVQSVDNQRDAISWAQAQFVNQLNNGLQEDGISGASATVEVEKKFTTIPYLVMEVDHATAERIQKNSLVASIEIDVPQPPTLADSVPLIGANTAWSQGYNGSGQAVAILDTGVDKTHSALSGKVIAEACYSTTSSGSSATTLCPDGSEMQIGNGSGVDCSGAYGCGHGTHVAGTVAANSDTVKGVAPGANLIAIQVFSKFSSTSYCVGGAPCVLSYTSDQIAGLERVLELHDSGMTIASINMSLGGGRYTTACFSSMQSIINNLRSLGIATVVASGNNGYTDGISSPSCVDAAISVGATTKSDTVASYSNSASILDLLAPGSGIVSTLPGNNMGTKSGTSMATPHVAGAFALLKSAAPTATIDELETLLKNTGKPITDSRNGLTKPRINLAKAIEQLAPANKQPNIAANPLTYNFGNVNVSETSDVKIITITNVGEGELKIGQLTLPSTDFILANDTCSNQSLATTSTCTVQITFKPQTAGAKNATLSIASNDPDTNPLTVTLTGNGILINVEPEITPASCRLYAVHDQSINNSQFISINILDESYPISTLGSLHLDRDIEAIAIHPQTNIIYAASGDEVTKERQQGLVYKVDAKTGKLTEVGSTGFKEIEALAFSADGNTLWAWAKGDGMITVDQQTGKGNLIVPADIPIEGFTLSKKKSTVFYGAVNADLWIYDSATGNLNITCTGQFPGETEALTTIQDQAGNDLLLIGVHNDKRFKLHVFDPATCQVLIAQEISSRPFNDIEGIAIPTQACVQ